MYHFGSSWLSPHAALFVFTLPPTPYNRGNMLLLYLYCLQSIAFLSFFDVVSTLAFTAVCFTSSEFIFLSWRCSNQFEYLGSPLASSTSFQVQPTLNGIFKDTAWLTTPRSFSIWWGNMWPSDLVFECLDNQSKDLLWSNLTAIEKREETIWRKQFGMLQICGGVFCGVRSYPMSFIFIFIYIIYIYEIYIYK